MGIVVNFIMPPPDRDPNPASERGDQSVSQPDDKDADDFGRALAKMPIIVGSVSGNKSRIKYNGRPKRNVEKIDATQ